MNRSTFLRCLGVIGLGAGGASIWRAHSNHVLSAEDGPAYAPWTEWQQAEANPFEPLVRAAVLAASPHNTQPWKFRLLPDGVHVYADTSRRIGAIDPLLREMHIGVGCAIENLLLAAEARGYQWRFDDVPTSERSELQPIAQVHLSPARGQSSDLHAAIPHRHTNRGPYCTDKEVDEQAINGLEGVRNSDTELRVFWFRKPEEKQAFGNLVVQATQAIIADQEQSESSARWMRSSWSDIQRFRDGLTYDAMGLSPGMRTAAKFLPPLSVEKTDQFWLNVTREVHVATADAFGMIAVRDASNTQQRVEAGRLWQRMHLSAALRGIAMQPLSQPVERRDRELQLGPAPTYTKALFVLQQDDRWQGVLPFRLGYPVQKALASPRRALASVLI